MLSAAASPCHPTWRPGYPTVRTIAPPWHGPRGLDWLLSLLPASPSVNLLASVPVPLAVPVPPFLVASVDVRGI
jgi:hypothetical protein